MNDIRVYRVNRGSMEWLADKIEKLNKRAAKLNAPAIVFYPIEGAIERIPVCYENDPGRVRYYKEFQMTVVIGAAPKFNGWSLAGEPNPKRKPSKSGRRQRITSCAGCGRQVYVCCAYGCYPHVYHWECWPPDKKQ